ncbi:unnamed protein product [Mytilus edulis]|uniref:B box-type domain-containing protein n=1 Tax=Mytilus edulis TaxID=6550 RepID=A0A8S3SZI4_MYTED|nr:unnamed protein product [Mytilus edulis]
MTRFKISVDVCTTATLYYSDTDNKSYYQAEQFCNNVGGVLLRYGERFSKVIRTCGKTRKDVWTGKPWYLKWENCYYDGNINTLRTAVVNRTSDKHVGKCADFCANENYTRFAVQTKSCFCYNKSVIFTASFCFGQEIQCPGNSNDVCGTGEYGSFPYYVVYEKVGSSDDIECNLNDLLQSKSSENTGGKDMATRVKELCDICYNQHITSEAIIFCSKCDEKLCERCRANHSVARLSRKHECITLENFSKLPKFVQNSKLYCKTHDERYEYYCFEHDEPCCISCFNGVHSKCPYMSSLQNVVKNIKFSQEFCDLQRKILDLIHNISKVIADRRENLQELKNQKIKCRQAIRSARATVNAILDKMEHEITMKMYKEFAEKESDIENLLEIFERYFSIINKSKECLDTIKSFATDFQALLGARQISIDANCVHKATRKVFKGKHLTHVKISMKPTALSLIKSKLNSLGTLNVKYFSRRLSYEARWIGYAAITMKSPDIQLKAKFSVTIPGFEGTEKLNISGCCILEKWRYSYIRRHLSQTFDFKQQWRFEKSSELDLYSPTNCLFEFCSDNHSTIQRKTVVYL